MQRRTIAPRPDWQKRVEAQGCVWHGADTSEVYWAEGTFYALTDAEIDRIAAVSEELHQMFIAAGDRVIGHNLFARFGIPDWCVPLIRDAWEDEPPALNHGRFDLAIDRNGTPRLFEYNCDTPTSLIEASLVQWDWKEGALPHLDQYNRIHEALVERWTAIAPDLPEPTVHFAHAMDALGEDMLTTGYMMDIAREAGIDPRRMTMAEIGWAAGADGGFFDGQDQPVSTLFKLYPWEWLAAEPFGRNIAIDPRGTLWIEPIWKMLWSNKAILPVLWELYPDHPNLLGASFEPPPPGLDHVIKPMLGREGGNVRVVKGGQVVAEAEGRYTGPVIYQELCDWQDFGGRYPVIGSWMVDGTCCGLGIREGGLITTNRDQFVPHVIDD